MRQPILSLFIALTFIGCVDKEKQQLQYQVSELSSQIEEVHNQLLSAQIEVDSLKSEIDELSAHIDSFADDDWRDVVANVQYSIQNVESTANNVELAIQQAIDAAN